MARTATVRRAGIIAGASFLVLAGPVAAKDRYYHRMKTSDVITVPGIAKPPLGTRAVTDAEVMRLLPRPADGPGRIKHEKYHEIGNTRIVWLMPTKPNRGYTRLEAETKSNPKN